MWLMTKEGFFSIVLDESQSKNEILVYKVRARKKQDLQNLVKKVPCLKDSKIHCSDISDYCCRIFVGQNKYNKLMKFLSSSINYYNFKGEIKLTPGQSDKLECYSRIWGEMLTYQLQQQNADKEQEQYYHSKQFQILDTR